MKYLKKLETADSILINKKDVSHTSEQTYPFMYYNNELFVGKESSVHFDNKYESGMLGRIFLKYKIIGIWFIEKYTKDELVQFLEEIKKHFNLVNFNDWFFDIPVGKAYVYNKTPKRTHMRDYVDDEQQNINNFNISDDTIRLLDLYESKNYTIYIDYARYIYAYIPISDYLKNNFEAITDVEAYKKHLEDKNKKVSAGWGSRNTKNNIEWRQALGENMILKFCDFINETKSNMKSFDYVAIQNNFKGEPILYVTDFKIIKDNGEKCKCKIIGYKFSKIDDNKYGFVKIEDYHILNKSDFKNGTAKRKIYEV